MVSVTDVTKVGGVILVGVPLLHFIQVVEGAVFSLVPDFWTAVSTDTRSHVLSLCPFNAADRYVR